MESISKLLVSHQKLERDRGLEALSAQLSSDTPDTASVEAVLSGLIQPDPENPWEQYHGALQASSLYISSSSSSSPHPDFLSAALSSGRSHLTHPETRVRGAAGKLLGALAACQGAHIYETCRSDLLSGITACLERHQEPDQAVKEKVNGGEGGVFHDTAGWGTLETSMKALEAIITGTGARFDGCIDAPLLDLVLGTLTHTNRFVRETGYRVCGALVAVHPAEEGAEGAPRGAVWREGGRFAAALEAGLSDNWSQVRMAACAAARAFLLGLPEPARTEFYPSLLPALCLNRYYVAEGVRLHCQATWRLLFAVSGVKAVEENLPHIVPFYLRQAEADNHAVREAACACIAELATKVGSPSVNPFVPQLLEGLLVCFQDDSWPVRDAACAACGSFVSVFGAESESYVERLLPLFYANLADNIPSVRQGGAVAIAAVVATYPGNLIAPTLARLEELLRAVGEQPTESKQFAEMQPAVFGVAMPADPAHTDQVMYSCGSLAPKMGRGKAAVGEGAAPGPGGCSASHHFRRPAQPWEKTDGAVRLFAELAGVTAAKAGLVALVPALARTTRSRHFDHHVQLLETIYRALPVIFRRLTKPKIKPHLNEFLDGLKYGLKSDNNLLRAASVECLQSLSLLLGPNILRGRIEMTDPDMLLYVQQAFPETVGS